MLHTIPEGWSTWLWLLDTWLVVKVWTNDGTFECWSKLKSCPYRAWDIGTWLLVEEASWGSSISWDEELLSSWLALTKDLFLLKLGMHMFLIAKVYSVSSSITKYAHSRRIRGVIEATFMLEIWLVCNIHQNRSVFNLCEVL